MDRAGSIYRFNGAAVGANKIVAVLHRNKKSEVSGTFMKAKAADHAFAAESLEKTKNCCLVALFGKVSAGDDFG